MKSKHFQSFSGAPAPKTIEIGYFPMVLLKAVQFIVDSEGIHYPEIPIPKNDNIHCAIATFWPQRAKMAGQNWSAEAKIML